MFVCHAGTCGGTTSSTKLALQECESFERAPHSRSVRKVKTEPVKRASHRYKLLNKQWETCALSLQVSAVELRLLFFQK